MLDSVTCSSPRFGTIGLLFSLCLFLFIKVPIMSWRVLIATLLLGITASVWAGFQLGNWLIENGPLKSNVFDAYTDLYTVPTFDADGKPFVPSPPQPLVDGSLAVPNELERINWEIDDSTNLLQERPPIALATSSSASGSSINRQHISPSGLKGIAQVGNLSSGGSIHMPNDQVIQPIEIGALPPPPSQEVKVNNLAVNANPNWQANFQRELKACEQLGFTRVPSCKWDARNKYCEPNKAWGKVPNCPPKSF